MQERLCLFAQIALYSGDGPPASRRRVFRDCFRARLRAGNNPRAVARANGGRDHGGLYRVALHSRRELAGGALAGRQVCHHTQRPSLRDRRARVRHADGGRGDTERDAVRDEPAGMVQCGHQSAGSLRIDGAGGVWVDAVAGT